jgi:murein DD-endopeptidase MepM/ murein hydrolase activator NlpD
MAAGAENAYPTDTPEPSVSTEPPDTIAPTEAVDATATAGPHATTPPTGSSGSISVVPPTPPGKSVEPERLTGYKWPLRRGRMTSFFAPRDSGFLLVDGTRIHPGLDLATFCGDRVYAAHGGIVIASGRRYLHAMGFSGSVAKAISRINRRNSWPQMAITVVVDDGNGYRSLYAHLSETAVDVGDTVRTGQLLGYEGATGDATGCHLHYEVIRMDGGWFRVAPDRVREYQYPPLARERVDPLRILSLKARWHGRFIPGINPPHKSPGLGRPTAHNPHDR